MNSKLVKKRLIYILVIIALAIPVTRANGQWEEMIYPHLPYGSQIQQTEQRPQPSSNSSQIYRVQTGDTLWGLAAKYNTTVKKLAAANGLSSNSQLLVGQVLTMPGGTFTHTVKQGETLISICRQHNVTMGQLLKANNLSNPDILQVGQVLHIPDQTGTEQLGQAVPVSSWPVPTMAWPVSGSITSHFGIRQEGRPHQGVDIAAAHGVVIKAAKSGQVVFAGYYGSYGNTVIIDHGSDIRTLYAHCSTLLVKQGNYVQQGQAIAKVGDTGRSFGPHLHWEVQCQGIPFDPLLCTNQ